MDPINHNRIIVAFLLFLSIVGLFVHAKVEESLHPRHPATHDHQQVATNGNTSDHAHHSEDHLPNLTQEKSRTPMTAEDFVHNLIDDNKVVIFSKVNCPYCVLAKDLFASLGEHYHVVELDTVVGGQAIHEALKDITGQRTVPNIFVNSEHVGGYTDTNSKRSSGELTNLLKGSVHHKRLH